MLRDAPFVNGETYHLYNRGAHKQAIFTTESDYRRFLLSLFLSNGRVPVNIRETLRKYKGLSFVSILEKEEQGERLVELLAYSLMPNHFHLVLRQLVEGGITKFTKKLLTSYSMYFNTLYEHSGILSQGTIKSRHVGSEAYFRYIFAYVHLNPLALHLPNWETVGIVDQQEARRFLQSYSFSSFYDYSVGVRPERNILAFAAAPAFLRTQNDLEELLKWVSKDSPL